MKTLIALRAISVNEYGASYDVIATHPNLPKLLVDILDIPLTDNDKQFRISLQNESLWILTNLSVIDGFNKRLFNEFNIQEIL